MAKCVCSCARVFEQHIFDIAFQLHENEILFIFLPRAEMKKFHRLNDSHIAFSLDSKNAFKFVCALADETAGKYNFSSFIFEPDIICHYTSEIKLVHEPLHPLILQSRCTEKKNELLKVGRWLASEKKTEQTVR